MYLYSLACTFIIFALMFILFAKIFYPKIKMKIVQGAIKRDFINRKFILNYQPIIDLNNKVIGLETLIRYKNKYDEIVYPREFLDKIYQNNMSNFMTIWILEEIRKNYKNIFINNIFDTNYMYISINILPNDLIEEKLFKTILSVNKVCKGLNLCIELIEETNNVDYDTLKGYITQLRSNNIKVALDDFGKKNSNIDILRTFNFEIVKLDILFIRDLGNLDIKYKIFSFIINIAKYYNISLIIEGVETKKQREFILSFKYDKLYLQGYLFSKPLDLNSIKNFTLD